MTATTARRTRRRATASPLVYSLRPVRVPEGVTLPRSLPKLRVSREAVSQFLGACSQPSHPYHGVTWTWSPQQSEA